MQLAPTVDETIAGTAAAIRDGRRTCVHVVESRLQRIDEMEESIRAWVIVDRRGALEQAVALDAELATGAYRGPLHGIPLGIKDIIDVGGFPTACGSHRWRDRVAKHDATIVARLRAAGAIVLGKTVTTQYASFDPPITRNPWHAERTPAGSSSGSAAGVACGMCLGALGTQTGGSINRPAAFCGVAGCKATHGRVSLHGILPLAPSLDHPGPIARTVGDLAILLDAIAGVDPADPLCADTPFAPTTAMLDGEHSARPKLGRLGGLFDDRADDHVRPVMSEAVKALADAGASIRETAWPSEFEDLLRQHRIIMAVEGAAQHERRMREHPDDYLPMVRALIEEGLATSSTDYARARHDQIRAKRRVLDLFADVDALIAPATTGPASDCSTTGDPSFNSPWSYTGLPTINFPIGLATDGLPLSVQIIGRPFDEPRLFRVAQWCEAQIQRVITAQNR